MALIAGPRIEARPPRHYLGIRTVTPFRGMLSVRDQIMEELFGWLDRHALLVTETFFRLHVVDMEGPMDLEVGSIVPQPVRGDDGIRPGLLPRGDYATLTYRDHALRANRALFEWAAANSVTFDREAVPDGDRFGCRYELYLTDPRIEPRKTRWAVQLNILTRPHDNGGIGGPNG